MKKALLVSRRTGLEKETKASVIWLTMYVLPSTYTSKDGTKQLFYPKSSDAILFHCIKKDFAPDDYAKFLGTKEGAICLVHFGVNELTNKVQIRKVDVLPGSDIFNEKDLYEIYNDSRIEG